MAVMQIWDKIMIPTALIFDNVVLECITIVSILDIEASLIGSGDQQTETENASMGLQVPENF